MKKKDFARFVGMAIFMCACFSTSVFAQKYVVILNKTSVYDEPKDGSTIKMNQFSEDISLNKGKVFELVATVGKWYQVQGNFCGEGTEEGYVRIGDCLTDGEALADAANRQFMVNNDNDIRLSFFVEAENRFSAKVSPVNAQFEGLNESLSGVSQGNILLFIDDMEEIKYTVVKLNGRIYIYKYGFGVL